MEDYVEEFINISHCAMCDDLSLMDGFWCGLDKDVNFALWVDGSSFVTGKVVDKNIAIQPHPTSTDMSPSTEPSQPSFCKTDTTSEPPQ